MDDFPEIGAEHIREGNSRMGFCINPRIRKALYDSLCGEFDTRITFFQVSGDMYCKSDDTSRVERAKQHVKAWLECEQWKQSPD